MASVSRTAPLGGQHQAPSAPRSGSSGKVTFSVGDTWVLLVISLPQQIKPLYLSLWGQHRGLLEGKNFTFTPTRDQTWSPCVWFIVGQVPAPGAVGSHGCSAHVPPAQGASSVSSATPSWHKLRIGFLGTMGVKVGESLMNRRLRASSPSLGSRGHPALSLGTWQWGGRGCRTVGQGPGHSDGELGWLGSLSQLKAAPSGHVLLSNGPVPGTCSPVLRSHLDFCPRGASGPVCP